MLYEPFLHWPAYFSRTIFLDAEIEPWRDEETYDKLQKKQMWEANPSF